MEIKNLRLLSASTQSPAGVQLAVAITWLTAGANFLGFKIAVGAIPPFLMMSLRVGVAGLLLLLALFAMRISFPRFDLRPYRDACLSGFLFLALGQGLIVAGVQYVGAGYAALLAATAPLMTAMIAWILAGARPGNQAIAGILLGFGGLLLLIVPSLGIPGTAKGVGLILAGTLAWGAGMHHATTMRRPESALVATVLQMLPASVILLIMSAVSGEWDAFVASSVSVDAWAALAYLIIVGSLLGYSAFVWILPRVSPQVANSFFYVGPVIALFLGWMVLEETVRPLELVGALITLAGVALMISSPRLVRRGQ
ncbi:MAG: EamA family transporter [Pseudomonadota bacterium]